MISKNINLKNFDRENDTSFSPHEFMRSRHPDLFSDSTISSSITIPPQVFEYHLETLTSRKQEIEFEHFCRRLAEKELCPNLIPQTGPLGGGDSQVDTETYPVADQLALRWYDGIGREASNERWAFAFSAKKAWRAKVNSDIEKIVNTNRNYTLTYFITNQFVRDKTRVEVEESLKIKYGIQARILDRSWIMKCVFEHDRLWLAIETLKIPGYNQLDAKQIGPEDTRRRAELKELEEQIDNIERYHGVEYQLAEDCLEAAVIARGLEFPRVDVDGRFQRAVRVAERINIRQQKLRIIYSYAWTEYWWYEDYVTFNSLYDRVEVLAIGSAQADDIELLVNLWQLLHTAVKRGLIKDSNAALSGRTKTVKEELDRLIGDERRPNNALQARTNRLLIDLSEALAQEKCQDIIFDNFKDVLIKSEGLSEYPITPLIKIIQELGDIFTDSPKYDELFDVVVHVAEKRASEGRAGQILLERGKQKVRSGKNYDAIKLIGRAQQKLAMDEYKSEWITSLVLCGLAYESVGLIWAARANFLMATNKAFSEYIKNGKSEFQTLRYVQKLIWLELQLGRIPYVLSWMEFSSIVANLMAFNADQRKEYADECTTQDHVLAISLIKVDFWELKWLDSLPSILERMGLYSSWMTLLYTLGYEERLREEGVIPSEENPETIRELFGRLYTQPANNDIPDHSQLMNGITINLVSPVLGCKIIVNVTNNPTALFVAENIIGALEAFLATSFDSDIMPYRSELHITIRTTDYLVGLPEYTINRKRQGEIEIYCPTMILKDSSANRTAYRDWIQKIILDITFQITLIPDPEIFVAQVIKDERSFDRAIIFSDVEMAIINLLGEQPKIHISDWGKDMKVERYPLIRDVPWDSGFKKHEKLKADKPMFRTGDEIPPDSLFDMDRVRHKDRKVVSLIDVPLWDQAKWQAIGYVCAEHSIPILALCFKNPEAANKIFEEWCEMFGDVDEENKLRIAIITGVNKKHPLNYKVLVTANMENMGLEPYDHFVLAARFIEMFPQTLKHSDYFLNEYKKVGRFVLVPAKFNAEQNQPEPIGKFGLGKYDLVVRPAWEIGPNDPDVFVIQEGDEPIIPKEEKNAPVLRALRRFDKRRNRKRHK